ncbi:hypothetical protein D3C85_1162840 [compost metagenome]
MAAFGRIQPQHARQIFQEGGRHADVAALFKPRVPGQSHAGQRRHFLAAQPGGAAAAARRQPEVGGAEPFAAQAQEFGQGGASAVQPLGRSSSSHEAIAVSNSINS